MTKDWLEFDQKKLTMTNLNITEILMNLTKKLQRQQTLIDNMLVWWACLKRRHVYEAVWPKLISADVYQCLRQVAAAAAASIFSIFGPIHPLMFIVVVIFIIFSVIFTMLMFVVVNFLVMFTNFGHIHLVILIW